MKRNFILLSFILISCISKAGHVFGGEITYRNLDSMKYEIKVVMYRWCNGIPLSSSLSTSIRCLNSTTSYAINLKRTSIETVTRVCSGGTNPCSPANTYGTGEGVERHTFMDTIEFTTGVYYPLQNCGGPIIIQTGQCCRGIHANVNNGNFYTYAMLDPSKGLNSSPEFVFKPKVIRCCLQPVRQNIGAIDTADGDSLSYALVNVLEGFASSATYKGNYTATHPFTPYYPGSLGPPYKNAKASPPIGITFDQNTGDLIYTPTDCSESSAHAIEVSDWRKDSLGQYQLLGTVRRDLPAINYTCPNNNPPTITSLSTYYACAGDTLEFLVHTNDVQYVPPPPLPAPAPDSVRLIWNEGIPEASFTIQNSNARLQKGKFVWAPTEDMVRERPYYFAVEAVDNSCNLAGMASQSIAVIVKKKAEAEIEVDSLSCGRYRVSSTPDSNNIGPNSFQWSILDTSRNQVEDGFHFEGTGLVQSLFPSDVLQFTKNGTYIIQHNITAQPSNCGSYYYDTLVVTNAVSVVISDMDSVSCASDSFEITTDLTLGTGPYNYIWTNPNGQIDTTSSHRYDASLDTINQGTFLLKMVDSLNCEAVDEVTVYSYPVNPYSFDSVYSECSGNGIPLSIPLHYNSVIWNDKDTSNANVLYNAVNNKVSYLDTNGCLYRDSLNLIFHQLPQTHFSDSVGCDSLELFPGNFNYYEWFNGENTSKVSVNISGFYDVLIEDSNGCANTGGINVQIYESPSDFLFSDTTFCGDSLMLTVPDFSGYDWSNGDTTESTSYYESALIKLTVLDSALVCYGLDTMVLELDTFPSPPTIRRQGNIYLSDKIGLHTWYLDGLILQGKTQTFIDIIYLGTYSAKHTNSFGCISESSNEITHTVGYNALNINDYTVYPNPTNGKVYISGPIKTSTIEIQLYDALSRKINFEKKTFDGGYSIEWEGDPGLYLLNIETEDGSSTLKINKL